MQRPRGGSRMVSWTNRVSEVGEWRTAVGQGGGRGEDSAVILGPREALRVF